MLNQILCYFIEDPLRVLYLLGGSGGLWYWITVWCNRIRIRVVVKNEIFKLSTESNLQITVGYEIENIGSKSTSLSPTILITGYTPDRKPMKVRAKVTIPDRELPPFNPKLCQAEFEFSTTYPYLLFRTYTFKLTRGAKNRVRVWSASLRNVNRIKFLYELFLFKSFGKYNEPII